MRKRNSHKLGYMLNQAGKRIKTVVQDKRFQLGALLAIPAIVNSSHLIRKYKKQAQEKEELYKEALAKHNAAIKELDARAEIDKEKRDRLMAYDAKLKKEMSNYQFEIQKLKEQIAELEKEDKR